MDGDIQPSSSLGDTLFWRVLPASRQSLAAMLLPMIPSHVSPVDALHGACLPIATCRGPKGAPPPATPYGAFRLKRGPLGGGTFPVQVLMSALAIGAHLSENQTSPPTLFPPPPALLLTTSSLHDAFKSRRSAIPPVNLLDLFLNYSSLISERPSLDMPSACFTGCSRLSAFPTMPAVDDRDESCFLVSDGKGPQHYLFRRHRAHAQGNVMLFFFS